MKITEKYFNIQNNRCNGKEIGDKLEFDYNYASASLDFLLNVFETDIYEKLKIKYGSINKISAMRDVWNKYLHGVFIPFDEIWEFDEKKGSLTGFNHEKLKSAFMGGSNLEKMLLKLIFDKYCGAFPLREDDEFVNVYYDYIDDFGHTYPDRKRIYLELQDVLIKNSDLFMNDIDYKY